MSAITIRGHIRDAPISRFIRPYKCKKKLQFIHMLTASKSNTSKTAKIIKGDITYHHIAYVNVLISNITFMIFVVCLPIAPTAVWARSLS